MKRIELYNNVRDTFVININLEEVKAETAFTIIENLIEANNGFISGSFLAQLPNSSFREEYEGFRECVIRDALAPTPECWTVNDSLIIPIGSGYFIKGVFSND